VEQGGRVHRPLHHRDVGLAQHPGEELLQAGGVSVFCYPTNTNFICIQYFTWRNISITKKIIKIITIWTRMILLVDQILSEFQALHVPLINSQSIGRKTH
jgi:hypothetical protein